MSKRAAFVIASLTAALAMQSSASQRAEGRKPSNTWQMRCVLKVTADTEVLPLNFELLESLLRSDAVAEKAAQTAWPKGHGISDTYFDVQALEDAAPQEPSEDDAVPATVSPLPTRTRTVLLALRVHLDSDVGPVAREFGKALIENLRAELQKTFAAHRDDLQRQLEETEVQHKMLRTQFEDMLRQGTFTSPQPIQPDPADEALAKQLHKVVDLSAITLQTPASRAFKTLAQSVEPPLNIVVLWRDLVENANVDATSPIEIDGPSQIQLGTALQNMLDALTDPLAPGREYRVDYIVAGGAITVGTRLGLSQAKLETRVYDLPPLLRTADRTTELAALIRETVEPASWRNPYFPSGAGTVAPSTDGRLIVSQSRDVHIKIQEFLIKAAADFAVTLPEEASQETLTERLEFLLQYREQLERELDRLQDRQGQIEKERNEKERRALQSIGNDLYKATAELKEIRADMEKAGPNDPRIARLQQAIRTLEQCGDRCNEAAPRPLDLSGEILVPHGSEAQTVSDRIAAKQSDLREVSRRIAETQRMMSGTKVFDPQINRIQWIAGRCEQVEARIHDLTTRLENLRPCTIVVLGGIE